MSTLTLEPDTSVPAPIRPTTRRWVAPVGLVVTLVVAWWTLAPVVGVQLAQDVTLTFAPDAGAVTLPDYGARGTIVLPYEHDASVRATLTLTNDGLVPVTVQDVRLDDGVLPLAVLDAAEVDGAGMPYSLAPGERVDVGLTIRLDNCEYYHERELELLGAALVDVRVLGRSATERVSFAHDLVVRSPMIIGCPDRLLNRQANDRTDVAG